MSKVTYTVSTSKKVATFTAGDVIYVWVKQNSPLDAGQLAHAGLLQPREMVLVYVPPGFSAAEMTNNDKFIVEVKPPIGAALPIARTVPAGMTTNNWYEVF